MGSLISNERADFAKLLWRFMAGSSAEEKENWSFLPLG